MQNMTCYWQRWRKRTYNWEKRMRIYRLLTWKSKN